jgi:predicted methyltransferase
MPTLRSPQLILALLLPLLLTACEQDKQTTGQAIVDNGLSAVISGEHRSAANQDRDQYRHPQQTLEFFGVSPEMTVVEVWPGGGWYTEILAPWIKQGGGQYISAGFFPDAQPEYRQKIQLRYEALLAELPTQYDQVVYAGLGKEVNCDVADAGSVDAVLTFRNVHNWLKDDHAAEMFNTFYKLLKPGGVLGVTEHRALPDTDLATMKKSGYVTQDLVISLAKEAGFVLEESSEINANASDNTDHPKGVWTLPPSLRLGDENRADYLAIGESDRMTLRFRKP